MNRLVSVFYIVIVLLMSNFAYSEPTSIELPDDQFKISSIFSSSWVPTGARAALARTDCDRYQLRKIITESNSPLEAAQRLGNFFNGCEQNLYIGGESGISALVSMLNVQYNYFQNAQITPLTIELPEGIKIKAVLGLKAGPVKRPLVIAQCGVTCDTLESASARSLVMHLFDETPFNLILLGSTTTSEFANLNKGFTVGGIEEGYHILEVAKWVRKSAGNLNKVTSSIHAVGQSLGGHGALFSSLYNDYYKDANNKPLLSSVQAFCPVVNLEESMKHIFSGSVVSSRVQDKLWAQVQRMKGFVSSVDDYLARGLGKDALGKLMLVASMDYWKEKGRDAPLAPLNTIKLSSEANILEAGDFSRWAANIKTPLMIWTGLDDPVVESDKNVGLLQKLGTVPVVETYHGSHCAFDQSYGWDILTEFMQAFILKNSPEFSSRLEINYKKLNVNFDLEFSGDDSYAGHRFSAEAGSNQLEVVFSVFVYDLDYCNLGAFGTSKSQSYCFLEIKDSISLGDIGTKGLKIPRNKAEAEALTRWANSNLDWLGANKERLAGMKIKPAILTWKSAKL